MSIKSRISGKSFRALMLGSVATMILTPLSAQAQTPEPEATAVEEIIVTAQRREERLQDVPVAISAFSEGQLEKLQMDDARDLTQATPGFFFTQSGFSQQVAVRGIGVRGTSAGDESIVPLFIDGVYQSSIAAGDFDFNNVERIEVLKGPQGALFGRNAVGGAINVVTKTPTATPEGSIRVSYGSFDKWVGKAYVSGGKDFIAASLATVLNRDSGYIDDPIRGVTEGGNSKAAVRAKVVVNPLDNLTLTLGASYFNNVVREGISYYQPTGNTPAARVTGTPISRTPFVVYHDFTGNVKNRQYGVSLTGVYEAPTFDITSVTGIHGFKQRINSESDGTLLDLTTTRYIQTSRNLYHETYLASTGAGRFSWVAGGVYFFDVSGRRDGNLISRSVSTAGVVGAPRHSTTEPTIRTSSYAAYAQGTFDLTPQWSITAAGRYTEENKSMVSMVGDPTSPAGLTLLPYREKTFNAFTPTAVIAYEHSPRLNIYAKAGQAFKSGVFNGSASTVAQTEPVNPEYVTQYEVGVKTDLTSWLRVNAAAYHSDYKDLQASVRRDNNSFTENAGKLIIDGLEVEAFIRPITNLNVRMGLSLMDGEYEDYPNATALVPTTNTAGDQIGGNTTTSLNANGKKLVRMPFETFNLGGDYTIPLSSGEVILSGNVYYQGKYYYEVSNRVVEPSRTLVNARIEWRSPSHNFGVALFGENLTDETYHVQASISNSGDNFSVARPRIWGAELIYDW